MTDSQENTFCQGEGDAWYRRNAADLKDRGMDWIARLVASIEGRDAIATICELGCANGWRLAQLREAFPKTCRFFGVDASAEAIAAGTRQFPDFKLERAMLSQLPYDRPFDVVIVNFVLHWIDRDLLARCVAEIDRVVKWGGYLALGDFMPDFPVKRHYHHLPSQRVYTYKQDYMLLFTGLGFYREVTRATFPHDRPEVKPGNENWNGAVDADSRAFAALLHKSEQSYVER